MENRKIGSVRTLRPIKTKIWHGWLRRRYHSKRHNSNWSPQWGRLDIWLKYHSCVVFYFLLYFVTQNSCSGSIVVLSSCSDGWRHTVQLICWRWLAQHNATLNLRQRQWSFWHDFDLMKVLKDHSVWKVHYRERKYAEIIINDTKNHFLNAISILPISNHNSFRLLSDKIARVYICLKNIFIF